MILLYMFPPDMTPDEKLMTCVIALIFAVVALLLLRIVFRRRKEF